MAYTINQGFHEERSLDGVQKGLSAGLIAIAIVLVVGALLHNGPTNNPSKPGAKRIPIVSSLSSGNDKSGPANGGANSSGSFSGSGGATLPATSGSQSAIYGGYGTAAANPTVIGGMGGGPTGSTSTGGGGTLPLNETLTIPPASVSTGDKPILDSSGGTIHIN